MLKHQSTNNYIYGKTSRDEPHIGAITDELKRVNGDLSLPKAVVKGIKKSVIKAGGAILNLPTTVNNLKGAYYESDYKFTHGIGENLPPNSALGKYNFLCELEKKVAKGIVSEFNDKIIHGTTEERGEATG